MRVLFFILLFPFLTKAQTVQINGTGRTVTINAPGQPASVNIAAPQYYDPQTGDITFTDDHFQYSISGYARTGFTARSTAGFVEFRTSETEFDVKVGGNWSTASSTIDEQSDCEVLVNGVYNQSVRLTADNTTQSIAITLPAGEKIVQLRNGYTANPLSGSITLPDFGVYVQGVVTTGPIEIEIPVIPTNKKLFIGNSITTGASGTHPSVTGWVGLLRADGWQTQSDSYGGRRILTTNTTLADEMAAFVDDEMNGSVSNELFFMLGTNNFGLSTGHTKAQFKEWVGFFVDALHDIRPDITIYLVSPLNRTIYDTPNSVGATLEDYADAEQELQDESRSWLKIMYGKNYVSLANLIDGLHPNQTGHQEVHDNFLIDYNLLNP